jgi:hypothetical protein
MQSRVIFTDKDTEKYIFAQFKLQCLPQNRKNPEGPDDIYVAWGR